MFSANSVKAARWLTSFAAVALSLLIAAPISVNAQVVGATLSGTVTDQSGSVIPNAQISIKNVATGVTRTITANTAGFYTAPNLEPGNYEITISMEGFSTQARTGINLTVGAQVTLDIRMQVGQVTQTIEVTGEAPVLQLASSSLSAVVSSITVRELPLNGRSWTDLAALQSGVSSLVTQPSYTAGGQRGNRGFGSQITVAGARPTQNNYRLDGISINDYANTAPGSVLGSNLGVDAIQEFSVLTGSFSAEYGRSSGGVVNAITRSGTNQFHGSAYEFLRNSALDARNFFDGPKVPPFRRNQFGGSIGGPIRKNKLFFFADYEGMRQSKGITAVDTVPSVAARAGNLCSTPDVPPPNACTPFTITVDPSALKYLPLWHLPNGGIKSGTNGDIGIFSFAGQQDVSENYLTARGTYTLSEKDSLGLTYVEDITRYAAPDSLNDVQINSTTNRYMGIIEETHIFGPTLVNSGRIGFNRDGVFSAVPVGALNPLAADTSLAAIPGQNAASVIVSLLTTFSGGVGGGAFVKHFWTSYQGYDDLVWTHGTHSLKFGGAVERMQYNRWTFQVPGGEFSFANLAGFLQNAPTRFRFQTALGSSASGGASPMQGQLRESIYGLYIQDDWHARSNLTLNLGLRWEMSSNPTDAKGKIANLVNLTDAAPRVGNAQFLRNPTLRNFEPRIGFSWDPFHNGKTAVRGGFVIFDILPMPNSGSTGTNFPFINSGSSTSLPVGSFYAGAASSLTAASTAEGFIDQYPRRSYVEQWNLNLQRELLPSLTAVAGYVGSHTLHQLIGNNNINQVFPTLTPQGYLFPAPIKSGLLINPNFGQIRAANYMGNAHYNGLQVGLQKMMSHGFQLQGSFTWAKGIDVGSSLIGGGDEFTNSIPSLPYYDLQSVRARSDFMQSRVLVINGLWHVPSPKSLPRPAEWITSGWDIGAIYKASDGVPFTATFGSDGDPVGSKSTAPFTYPNRLTGSGCQTLTNPGNPNNYIKTECFALPTAPDMAFWTAHCDTTSLIYGSAKTTEPFPVCFNLRGNSGRNIMTGPGISNLDLSLYKNNYVKRISESFNVQFRAEFFNILNHADFALPATPGKTDIFLANGTRNGTAGFINGTVIDSREIQFALKIVF